MNEWDMYREWAPASSWSAVVACCWEQRVGAQRNQRVLPDGRADLLFFDDGRIELTGLHDVVALPKLPSGTRIRGIRFRPAALAAACGVPASSLRNETVAAEDVFGQRFARTLTDPNKLDAWIRSITADERVDAAVRTLGSRSVIETADVVGVTRRHLDRLMVEHVGLPPKIFQRVRRFQRFVRAVDAGWSIAASSAEAGYADQSHLTRDVRNFSALTPARLAAERRSN